MEAEVLLDLMHQGALEHDASRVVDLICKHAVGLVGADYAGIRLIEEDGAVTWAGICGNRTDAWKHDPRVHRGRVLEQLREQRTLITHRDELVAAGKPPPSKRVREREGCIVELATALNSGGRILGALVMGWREDTRITGEQVRVAEMLAGYGSVVLDNAAARQESERRRAEAEALADLLCQGAAERDPDTAIGLICEQGQQLLQADYVSLNVFEVGSDQVWFGVAGEREPWKATHQMRAAGPTAQALRAGHAMVFKRIDERPDFSPFHRIQGGRTLLSAPCLGRRGLTGGFHAGWRRDVEVTPSQLRLSEAFAGYAAVIIENASAHVRLGQRAETMETINEQLTRVDELKTNLIGNVSHELRTPLTSIRAFSELLLDPNVDPDTRLEFAGIINGESERLTRLVSNLLDLSRMQAGGVEWRFQPLDVQEQLEHAVSALRPVAEEKSLELSVEVDPGVGRVFADPDGLQQALVNLISNAVKFTARGGVSVTASGGHGAVCIAVTDTGPGLSEADQERIFDRFYQAGELLTSRPAGSGLGLAITREILNQHGTTIILTSAPGAGSTFSFVLPERPPA